MSKLVLGLCIVSTTALVTGCVADNNYYETGPGYATTSYAVYSDPYPYYYGVSYQPGYYGGLGGWGWGGGGYYASGWRGYHGYHGYRGFHGGGGWHRR